MKKHLIGLIVLLSLIAPTIAMADCQSAYEEAITKKYDHLLFAKQRQKKVLIGTGVGVGVSTGVLFGVMFQLIVDGSIIPVAILEGVLFGTVFGGAAVGAVAVPMITYNQIIKGEIRGLKHARDLLNEAQAQDVHGMQINKVFKKLRKYNWEMDINALIDEVNEANSKNVFCSEGARPDYLHQIRKYLKPRSNAERDQEVPRDRPDWPYVRITQKTEIPPF